MRESPPVYFNDDVLAECVADYGTPTYIYDARILRRSYASLRDVFPEYVDIFYSLKANPNVSVCKLLGDLGAGAEVSSVSELRTALAAGITSDKILYVATSKKDRELVECVQVGVYAVVVESVSEIRRLNYLSMLDDRVQPVLLRLNPEFMPSGQPSAVMSGGLRDSQFGMRLDSGAADDIKRVLSESNNIDLLGTHIYLGTRFMDVSHILENTQKIVETAVEMNDMLGVKSRVLDVGGGFGVPYFVGEDSLDLLRIKESFDAITRHFVDANPGCRVIIESGRYLTAESGVYVTQILDSRRNGATNFLLIDGSIGSFKLAGSGLAEPGSRLNFPMRTFRSRQEQFSGNHAGLEMSSTRSTTTGYTIAGSLSMPSDVIAVDVGLRGVGIGDYLVIDRAGAYGPTASFHSFLGKGYPAECIWTGQDLRLVRMREPDDFSLEMQIQIF